MRVWICILLEKTRRGYAEDSIYAAMDGIVAHVNSVSAYSAYGKYLVLEHHKVVPKLYSLYGHLSSIEPGINKGTEIKVAQKIGKMGNSASYRIPLNRSHLHFEIGLRLTDNFQSWYNLKKFTSPNRHGNFSGFNLVGFDPLPFYSKYSKKAFTNPLEYINSLPKEAKIRVKTNRIPDFVKKRTHLCLNYTPKTKNGTDGSAFLDLTVYQLQSNKLMLVNQMNQRSPSLVMIQANRLEIAEN